MGLSNPTKNSHWVSWLLLMIRVPSKLAFIAAEWWLRHVNVNASGPCVVVVNDDGRHVTVAVNVDPADHSRFRARF